MHELNEPYETTQDILPSTIHSPYLSPLHGCNLHLLVCLPKYASTLVIHG